MDRKKIDKDGSCAQRHGSLRVVAARCPWSQYLRDAPRDQEELFMLKIDVDVPWPLAALNLMFCAEK